MLNAKASCLCGDVNITTKEVNPQFSVCHCETCRNWGGGPFFSLQCGTDVTIKGSENITMYASSEWATRGFCSACGTHLFYKLNKTGEYHMPVGIFKNLSGLEMNMQYFSDRKPDYYCFSNETKAMTKAEIMAYFASDV